VGGGGRGGGVAGQRKLEKGGVWRLERKQNTPGAMLGTTSSIPWPTKHSDRAAEPLLTAAHAPHLT
jgi:hypothetical protein